MTTHRSADRAPFRSAPDGIDATGKDPSGRAPALRPGRAEIGTRSAARPPERRAGVTLVEVLLAVFILGVCLLGIMQGITACVGVFDASTFVKQASNVLARGDAEHPLVIQNDPEQDLAVAPDGSLLDGWTYERECLEDEDEDGLFLVRTRVARGSGGEGSEKVYERLVWFSGAGTGSGGEGAR